MNKHSTIKQKNCFNTGVTEWIREKHLVVMAILTVGTTGLYGQSDIIPPEITSTGEAFLDFFLGEFALIILGIIWAGACLAFAFNKDSQRAKVGFIAVTISCVALGLTQTIINQFVSMGS